MKHRAPTTLILKQGQTVHRSEAIYKKGKHTIRLTNKHTKSKEKVCKKTYSLIEEGNIWGKNFASKFLSEK